MVFRYPPNSQQAEEIIVCFPMERWPETQIEWTPDRDDPDRDDQPTFNAVIITKMAQPTGKASQQRTIPQIESWRPSRLKTALRNQSIGKKIFVGARKRG